MEKTSLKNRSCLFDYRSGNHSGLAGYTFSKFFFLVVTTIACNIVGTICFLFRSTFQANYVRPLKKIIILAFGGIGNHLMLAPSLKPIKESYPACRIHMIVSSKACAEIFEHNPNVESLSVMNISAMNCIADYFRAGRQLSVIRPDAIIAAAGLDPLKGSLISFLSSAPRRIGEDWRGRGFLYTHKQKVNLDISEAQQNLNLAKFLNVISTPQLPEIFLTQAEISRAKQWQSELNLPDGFKIIGIHPGSGKDQNWKRWEIENFLEVAKYLAQNYKVKIIFFLGPDEDDLVRAVENVDDNFAIVNGNKSIRTTTAKIGCCDLFLSNDSGLRHIAVALGVNTIGIFGPTRIEKNHLAGKAHQVIYKENVLCRPCHYTKWWLACGVKKPCLKLISPKEVITSVTKFVETRK